MKPETWIEQDFYGKQTKVQRVILRRRCKTPQPKPTSGTPMVLGGSVGAIEIVLIMTFIALLLSALIVIYGGIAAM